jgi:UDP-N-acetylmuramyl pentapeptide synthase
MGEVGAHGAEFHAEIGRYARERGLGALITFGEATRDAVAAFGAGARQCASVEETVAAARECAVAGATLLVKGSRFMRMERISAALTGQAAEGH